MILGELTCTLIHCSFFLIQTWQDHNTYNILCTIVMITTCDIDITLTLELFVVASCRKDNDCQLMVVAVGAKSQTLSKN